MAKSTLGLKSRQPVATAGGGLLCRLRLPSTSAGYGPNIKEDPALSRFATGGRRPTARSHPARRAALFVRPSAGCVLKTHTFNLSLITCPSARRADGPQPTPGERLLSSPEGSAASFAGCGLQKQIANPGS